MSKEAPHRFLLETRSQQLHRLEAIRRRRELLERESQKPVQMRFGIGGRGPSWSPPPRIQSPVVTTVNGVQKRPAETRKGFSSCSRCPRSCEPRKATHVPLVRSRSAPHMRLSQCLATRSTSNRRTSLVPPFGSLCNLQQKKDTPPIKRMLKRQRSRTVSTSPSTSLTSRFRRRTPLASARNKEKMTPWNNFPNTSRSAQILTPPLGPKHGKRVSAPRERSPSPLPSSTQTAAINGTTHDEQQQPAVTLGSETVSSSPTNRFPLPRSRSASNAESKEMVNQHVGSSSLRCVSDENMETATAFRVSEFPTPRTPKLRESLAVSLSPATSQGVSIKQELVAETRISTDSSPPVVKEEATCNPCDGLLLQSSTCQSGFVGSSSVLTGGLCEVDIHLNEESDAPPPCEIETSRDNKETRVSAAASPAGESDIVSMSPSSPGCKAAGACRPSAMTSYTFDCSPTTSEFDGTEIERNSHRQLMFDMEESQSSTVAVEDKKNADGQLHQHVSGEDEELENDSDLNNREEELCTPRDNRGEWLPDTLTHGLDASAESEKPHECVNALCTPVDQILYSSPLCEMVSPRPQTPLLQVRMEHKLTMLNTAEREDENSRGSLLLVTGESPIPHTPVLQEPHTPPPTEGVPLFISNTSNLPRPVTLISALQSPMSARRLVRPVAESPIGECAVWNGGKWSPPMRTDLNKEPTVQPREVVDLERRYLEAGPGLQGESVPSSSSSPCSGSRFKNKKLPTDLLMVSHTLEASEEAHQPITSETSCCTPSHSQGNDQASGQLSGSSSTAQPAASQLRKHYYEKTHWEQHQLGTTASNIAKEHRRSEKVVGKVELCASKVSEAVAASLNFTAGEKREREASSDTDRTSQSPHILKANAAPSRDLRQAGASPQGSSQSSTGDDPIGSTTQTKLVSEKRHAKKHRRRRVRRFNKGGK
ncbi:hypothetical protein, conserved [Trypanosoma brucei gambiense DAL972]|uniref:Uncharacterized protein n=1 Tax=Trypanosoma brucei gambiense (strain MHOM/CI/86/DAL972) TaxID=679716 RepID=D0A9Z1_TRYB9|nr:hypothetical protein, conserved [Trypanosoma brucei gambiense DAL972]CBH18492.1 hypothetical protein, conserved [Trypanosoma brucei gambiense DAL972]|eukprot:XP_011780756.1 hypothetical protein, conserved [Trypanosoma brucei gambiense DAL972]